MASCPKILIQKERRPRRISTQALFCVPPSLQLTNRNLIGSAIHTGMALSFCLAGENSYCWTADRAALWKIFFPWITSACRTLPSVPMSTRTRMVPWMPDRLATSGYEGGTCLVMTGLSSAAQNSIAPPFQRFCLGKGTRRRWQIQIHVVKVEVGAFDRHVIRHIDVVGLDRDRRSRWRRGSMDLPSLRYIIHLDHNLLFLRQNFRSTEFGQTDECEHEQRSGQTRRANRALRVSQPQIRLWRFPTRHDPDIVPLVDQQTLKLATCLIACFQSGQNRLKSYQQRIHSTVSYQKSHLTAPVSNRRACRAVALATCP